MLQASGEFILGQQLLPLSISFGRREVNWRSSHRRVGGIAVGALVAVNAFVTPLNASPREGSARGSTIATGMRLLSPGRR